MTTPKHISFSTLEEITIRFSVDSRIGMGGYADVYKGVYEGRDIAVKLLHVNMVLGHNDQLFLNEVGNHFRAEHENIVQFVGYCYETKNIYVDHYGAGKFREHIYKVICSEYLQVGSLQKCLNDQSFAPDWSTRYNIIKGVCEGLNYLHNSVPQILHLDLKPANILLNSSMEPKLADLGLSRLFTQSHTHVTKNIIGTRKYMPPEFINGGKISPKNDIYSLGVVMIDIMTNSVGYSDSSEMDDVAQLNQQVLTNCSTMIEAASKYRSEELHQVKTCIRLAIQCVDCESNNRPTTADILDTLKKTEVNIPKSQLANTPVDPAIGPRNTIANTLKTMADELDYITNEHGHRNLMPKYSFNFNVQQVPDIRETSSSMEESLIIGRTDEKQKILSILSESMTGEMVILPIYGIGGIGKTTLAQLVFHDTQFHKHSRVWVYVSQEFDFKKIGNSIISQLTKEFSHIADKEILHNRLRELFAGKNILIVLDDLWEDKPYELDNLKTMLMPHLGNKVIIVTTRDEAIANKIRRNVLPYKLEVLTDDMCWTIIKQKSSFEDLHDKEQLEQIGRDIAIKCGGVALAAQSLGYMLREMTSDQWESVRDSYIWNLSTSEGSSSGNQVLTSLLLSYSHMHDFLKLCFSYCAVFRKGHNIVKYDLIHQWIALGFIEHSSTFDCMQLCEIYITQLLGMSFLQHSQTGTSSDERQDKDVTLFTMHDLVHDLAREILADKVNKEGNLVGRSCHYALLTDCSKPFQLPVSSTKNTYFNWVFNPFQKKSSPENIKAVHFVDCGKVVLHGVAFSPAKCLIVLDLSECVILKLPDSVGRLKQLRFLCAPRIQDQMIPSCITKLTGLNYLNLRGSRIEALPESIGGMRGLLHLDLSYCEELRELPISFSELDQLAHLDLSHCCICTSEVFGGLTNLQYLNLSVNKNVDVNHFSRLRGLPEVIGKLIKLRYLNLSGRLLFEVTFKVIDSISTLSNLEHLDLSLNKDFYSIPESMGKLRKLHTLDLSGCINLSRLPSSIFNMVSLKVLNAERGIPSESVLSPFSFASLPHFNVHAYSDRCGSNIILLHPTNPEELTIDRLENVKSAEEAQSIKLIEKQKLKKLTFQWTVAVRRFVDDNEVLGKLVPPSSVEELSMTGYMSASFPGWFVGIRLHLPNLSEICFSDFSKCNDLPQLGQLPNLKLLSLCRMKSLEALNTEYSHVEGGANELLFPKLERLNIEQCAKLRIVPCLPRAMYLSIVNCDNMLVSSWGESSSHSGAFYSSRVTELFVEDSKVSLHQWRLLHQLPTLRSLSISRCSDMTGSREIIQHLSSIQSLSLHHCDQAELPRWLGELSSLKKFSIWDSQGIRSLPDSILTNLEHLKISSSCYALKKWYESEENKMKIAHIREKDLCCGFYTKPKYSFVPENFDVFVRPATRRHQYSAPREAGEKYIWGQPQPHRYFALPPF